MSVIMEAGGIGQRVEGAIDRVLTLISAQGKDHLVGRDLVLQTSDVLPQRAPPAFLRQEVLLETLHVVWDRAGTA